MPCEAFFLPAQQGQRLCIFHGAPGQALRGLVLFVHPFAEEMNKSRRMAALQSRALAAAGYAVLQIDLHGCGDSSGDFGDARWATWVDDVVHACHWLRSRANEQGVSMESAPLWIWGLRGGCLLALAAAAQLDETCNFLFWQPPASGKVLLQQFLRLKLAADMRNGQAQGVMGALREQLAQGQSVEVAGYTLSAELAMGLQNQALAPPPGNAAPRRVEWFEVSAQEPPRLSALPSAMLEAWEQAAGHLQRHAVPGPAFWQSGEMVDAPELLAATTAALSALAP